VVQAFFGRALTVRRRALWTLMLSAVGLIAFTASARASEITAFITDHAEGTVSPLTIGTSVIGAPIPVGSGPNAGPIGIAITPDGQTAYVVNNNDGTVTPLNLADDEADPPITIGNESYSHPATECSLSCRKRRCLVVSETLTLAVDCASCLSGQPFADLRT